MLYFVEGCKYMQRKVRVLVFEDDPAVRTMLEYILSERGYEVFSFSDPTTCPLHGKEECTCTSGYNCADMIISDIKMPYLNGLSFILSQIKKGCTISPSNIAMISGFWTPECNRIALELGVKKIQKPFTVSCLDNWLDEREKTLDLSSKLVSFDSI
jgi:DNA-binding response OmpR family regulator